MSLRRCAVLVTSITTATVVIVPAAPAFAGGYDGSDQLPSYSQPIENPIDYSSPRWEGCNLVLTLKSDNPTLTRVDATLSELGDEGSWSDVSVTSYYTQEGTQARRFAIQDGATFVQVRVEQPELARVVVATDLSVPQACNEPDDPLVAGVLSEASTSASVSLDSGTVPVAAGDVVQTVSHASTSESDDNFIVSLLGFAVFILALFGLAAAGSMGLDALRRRFGLRFERRPHPRGRHLKSDASESSDSRDVASLN